MEGPPSNVVPEGSEVTEGVSWWLIILLAVLTYSLLCACTLLPVCCCAINKHGRNLANSMFMGVCQAFAAGVFLGACWLGLMPHIEEHTIELRRLLPSNAQPTSLYLRAPFFILLGFLCLFILEQLLTVCKSGGHSHNAGLGLGLETDVLDNDSGSEDMPLQTNTFKDTQHFLIQPHRHADVRLRSSRDIEERSSSHWQSCVGILGLMVAMGTHALFEGLTLGLQDDIGQLLQLALGMLLHECLCAVSYGVALSRGASSSAVSMRVLGAVAQPCMLPVGMLLGRCMPRQQTPTALRARLLLEAFAVGTFFYVASIEMLAQEFSNHSKMTVRLRMYKLAALILGVIVFAALSALTHHH